MITQEVDTHSNLFIIRSVGRKEDVLEQITM